MELTVTLIHDGMDVAYTMVNTERELTNKQAVVNHNEAVNKVLRSEGTE
ncbi:hypothetical protein SDC9_147268 [bioreactor metagenome]|uniref:Uncharacterized protein n=1 Tax=bioreactor metagenome TaxID=1076179 RepID=A0A645EH40_9ZZZZ